MHHIIIRRSLYIYRVQILILFISLSVSMKVNAQFSIMEHDDQNMSRKFHFGVALGYNKSDYKITLDSNFIVQKNILNVQPVKGPGFNLGIVTDYHISRYFDLRLIPALSFGEKNIKYIQKDSTLPVVKKIESVYLEFPLLLKYKSKPYKNSRMYAIAGLKYSIDMQSNATARRAQNLIKAKKDDYLFEYGIGIELHMPMAIVAPEIKISYGLTNVLQNDDLLIYSSVLSRLRTRTFLFTIHLEG